VGEDPGEDGEKDGSNDHPSPTQGGKGTGGKGTGGKGTGAKSTGGKGKRERGWIAMGRDDFSLKVGVLMLALGDLAQASGTRANLNIG
jgi:hypothetical protein